MAPPKTETDHITDARATLLRAILPHVMFDGWSVAALEMAVTDSGLDQTLVTAACPRGALDLAVAFHRAGDAAMIAAFAATDTQDLKIREKVALAIRLRLHALSEDREAVRKAASLFALPQHAAEGAALIWGTADAIWTALGDTSKDVNWYTKRATLSAVYGSVVLFWLGDESDAQAETWAFADRRIENVMQFETLKARVTNSPLGRAFAEGPGRFLSRISAPSTDARSDLPGRWPPG